MDIIVHGVGTGTRVAEYNEFDSTIHWMNNAEQCTMNSDPDSSDSQILFAKIQKVKTNRSQHLTTRLGLYILTALTPSLILKIFRFLSTHHPTCNITSRHQIVSSHQKILSERILDKRKGKRTEAHIKSVPRFKKSFTRLIRIFIAKQTVEGGNDDVMVLHRM
ncbi:hypothetical protein LOAG_12107 [Loa loa]|uniref:Uncharacterized protein n=1 Tax=Loa loa TaxID=7209 RepID=A0A1S0TLX5_LOALO|nr:hypothetical protein LOAG_12107 [Loa loa]EFO16399.1 hypothetical protein LOAG_12107 [Loa loa]